MINMQLAMVKSQKKNVILKTHFSKLRTDTRIIMQEGIIIEKQASGLQNKKQARVKLIPDQRYKQC